MSNEPLVEKELQATVGDMTIGGVVDYYDHNTRMLYDWKTCSDAIIACQRVEMSIQTEFYRYLLEQNGYTVDGVRYRFVTKPGIRYCAKDKTIKHYQDRCFEWLQQPNKLMETTVFPSDDARHLFLSQMRELHKRHNKSTSMVQMRNTAACFRYGAPCEYYPVCSQWLNADAQFDTLSELYERQDHESIKASDKVYYNTHYNTYTECEYKYYLRYICGFRKIDTETTSQLYTGSVFHVAISALISGGTEAAQQAVAQWQYENPALGDFNPEQDTAKALAMAQAASDKWL